MPKTICSHELTRYVGQTNDREENEAMLSSLQIENVAVIQKAEVHFENRG